ncbi:MAG: PAS domain-containing protein [Clostridia bacterium]|nr:PAS domain-containing protein [Clostridia bacterium]
MKDNIIQDMSEGVMTVSFDGIIQYINPAAESIFCQSAQNMIGKSFASIFLKNEENDAFNQAVIDAVYHKTLQQNLVPYNNGNEIRQIRIITSYLTNEQKRIGVIVVLADITELAELKIRHAQQVSDLLDSLVRAFSKAVDERSHYSSNHTKNMVNMARAFFAWLNRSGNAWKFSEEQEHAFLMTVWLHDIGKLAIPLNVLNKATRFGASLPAIRDRIDKIRLLNRVALLEGTISETEWKERDERLAKILGFLIRIDSGVTFSPEDEAFIEMLEKETWIDEAGERKPLLTEVEIACLHIRKGTLTEEERKLIQSHALVTGRILNEVGFPEGYHAVPIWAASHHEFLDASGYPQHLKAPEISKEVRLLTILDIFEALTAKDRPYKKPYSIDQAYKVLSEMAGKGKIDGEILHLFMDSEAYKALQ